MEKVLNRVKEILVEVLELQQEPTAISDAWII